MVGTGASAVQFVPEIAGRAARVSVFQRTGNWFLPRRNRAYPALIKAAIRRMPGLQAVPPPVRLRVRRIPDDDDPSIRARSGCSGGCAPGCSCAGSSATRRSARKAWPDYTFGCKRVLFSSLFLPALQRDDVELVTDPIAAIEPAGVRTADGRLHEVDCIIWGTGFRTNDFMFPMEITGAEGRTLADEWAGGAHAHLGIAVPGFPSLFLMYGPNTNTSGGSIVFYLEAQAAYIRQALQRVRDERAPRRSRSGPRSRRGAIARRRRGSPVPPGPSATPGTGTRAAGSSPTGPATCANTRS